MDDLHDGRGVACLPSGIPIQTVERFLDMKVWESVTPCRAYVTLTCDSRGLALRLVPERELHSVVNP